MTASAVPPPPPPHTTFENNLVKDDPVWNAHLKRMGVVVEARKERRNVKVRLLGNKNVRNIDVTDLRLVVDGKPEETAPFDGPLPPKDGPRRRSERVEVASDPIEVLRAQRARNDRRMASLTDEFKALRAHNDRIDAALAALAPTVKLASNA